MISFAGFFGEAIGSTFLPYAIVYTVMSRQFGFRFSYAKILALLLPSALISRLIQVALNNLGNQDPYVGLIATWGIPFILSCLVIFLAQKLEPQQNAAERSATAPDVPSLPEAMSSNVMNSFALAAEVPQADTLADDMELHMKHLQSVSTEIRLAAVTVFLENRTELLFRRDNWSDDERIEMGRYLRATAERTQKQSGGAACAPDDWAECWGLWAAGAWLEGGVGRSTRAYISHMALEQIVSSASAQ